MHACMQVRVVPQVLTDWHRRHRVMHWEGPIDVSSDSGSDAASIDAGEVAETEAAEAEEVAGKAADAATRRNMLPKLLHYILELARYDMDFDLLHCGNSIQVLPSVF